MYRKAFIHEVSVLASVWHPNIVELLGFIEQFENGIACIVVPWEVKGNVREFLQSGEWDIPERTSLVRNECYSPS